MSAAKLLETFAQAGEEDLAEVNDRIVKLQQELASLQSISRILSEKLHGLPQRKTRQRTAAGNGGGNGDTPRPGSLSFNIFNRIVAKGASTVPELAHFLGVPERNVRSAVSHAKRWLTMVIDDETGLETVTNV